MKNMRTFFAAMAVVFGAWGDGLASDLHEEGGDLPKTETLESIWEENDPLKILQRAQSLKNLVPIAQRRQDFDIELFMENFIVLKPEYTRVSGDIRTWTMTEGTQDFLRAELNRIRGQDPIPNRTVAFEKELEFQKVLEGCFERGDIQLSDHFMTEFSREAILAMPKERRKLPFRPFFSNDTLGGFYKKAVDIVIVENNPYAFDFYRLLTAGIGTINGENVLINITEQKGAPYYEALERHLGFNEKPYFNPAVDQIVVPQNELTAEQEELFAKHFSGDVLPDEKTFTLPWSWECTITKSLPSGSYLIKGNQISLDSAYSLKGNVLIWAKFFQILKPYRAASHTTILDTTGKIVVVAEVFDIHPDAKIHGESIEFIQIPRTEPFEDKPKKVRSRIKSNFEKGNFSSDVNALKFYLMENAISFQVNNPMDFNVEGHYYPFMITEAAYSRLNPLLWPFPVQTADEKKPFYDEVQKCVDAGLITFEGEAKYKNSPRFYQD